MGTKKNGNGEGTYRERADGRWEWRGFIDGQRESFYGKTKAEVRRKKTAAQHNDDLGLPTVRNRRKTLGSVVNVWLEIRKPPTSKFAPRTWLRYSQLLAHVTESLGGMPLVKLTPEQVELFYIAKEREGLSSSTVHRIHTVLRQVLDDAQKKGTVTRNVCTLVDPPKDRPHEALTYSAEQCNILLAAIKDNPYQAFYILALTTGMRVGELLGLHWTNVTLDDPEPMLEVRHNLQRLSQNERHVFTGTSLLISDDGYFYKGPKSKTSRRWIRLAPVAVEALNAHRARQIDQQEALGPAWGKGTHEGEDVHGDLIFTTPTGTPIDGRNFLRCQFYPLLARAGLPRIRLHDVRHTVATLLDQERDVTLKDISRLLGHASTAVTEAVYIHRRFEDQRVAVEALERIFGQRSLEGKTGVV